MTVNVTHSTEVVGTNSNAYEVSANAWNDEHVIEGLGTAAEADVDDLITKAEGEADTGFTLIKHKRAGTGTYARSAAELAALGGADEDSIVHWLDPTNDPEMIDGSIAVDQSAEIENAILDKNTDQVSSGRRQRLWIPRITMRADGKITFDGNDLLVHSDAGLLISPYAPASGDPLIHVTGDDVSFKGLHSLLTAATTVAHHYRLDGLRAELDNCHWNYSSNQETPSAYLRQADGSVVRNCTARGSNAVFGYIEGSNLQFVGNRFYSSSSGDDAFAIKAINRSSEDILFLGNYVEGFSNVVTIGSNIGETSDIPTDLGVRNVQVLGNFGKACGGITKIHPGAISAYYNGTVENIEFSHNQFEDVLGEKSETGFELKVGRGATIRNVFGIGNSIRARAYDDSSSGRKIGYLYIRHAGLGNPGVIEDIAIGCVFEDPFGGAAFGTMGTTGYPYESLVRIEPTNLTLSNIALPFRGSGCGEQGVRILSGANDEVTIDDCEIALFGQDGGGGRYGVNTDSNIKVGRRVVIDSSGAGKWGGTGTRTPVLAKEVTSDRLIGRDTAGQGDAEQLTVGGGIEFTGSGGIQTSAFTGDVTKAAGGTATTIANDAVTYAKMQNVSATDKVLGRSTSGAGDVEEIACTATGRTVIGAASVRALAATLGIGYTIAQSGTAVSHTGDTNMTTLATITIPANAMGANGRVEIEAIFDKNDTSDTVTHRIVFGGVNIYSVSQTTAPYGTMRQVIYNTNSTSAQISGTIGNNSPGFNAGILGVTAVDTTANADILIRAQLANSADTVTLKAYRVMVFPKD